MLKVFLVANITKDIAIELLDTRKKFTKVTSIEEFLITGGRLTKDKEHVAEMLRAFIFGCARCKTVHYKLINENISRSNNHLTNLIAVPCF